MTMDAENTGTTVKTSTVVGGARVISYAYPKALVLVTGKAGTMQCSELLLRESQPLTMTIPLQPHCFLFGTH